MTWNDCLIKHRPSLVSKFGEREAHAMIRIIKEDFIATSASGATEDLTSAEILSLKDVVLSIMKGVPIQYAIGIALFDELKLKVTSDVLIPRPETEELLYWAKDLLENHKGKKYVDIGTGSGCLALGMKKAAIDSQIFAIDKSEAALKITYVNSISTKLPIGIHCLDILDKSTWEALPNFNGIISNPPYIPQKELQLMEESVVNHEPQLALMVSNEDPLIFYRTIGEFAQQKLVSNGWLLFEINEFYGKATLDVLKGQGFRNVELKQDMQGKDRMVGCRK